MQMAMLLDTVHYLSYTTLLCRVDSVGRGGRIGYRDGERQRELGNIKTCT